MKYGLILAHIHRYMYIYSMESKELKRILVNNGIKQSWLAERLGVHRSQVYHWVNGIHPIPQKYIIEIKSLLRVAA